LVNRLRPDISQNFLYPLWSSGAAVHGFFVHAKDSFDEVQTVTASERQRGGNA
jgi:hypothetical protein